MTRTRPALTDHAAQEVADAVASAASAAGVPVAVAVVDDGLVLTAFRRLDGTRPMPVAVAQDKARTAASTGFDTADVAAACATDVDLRRALTAQPGVTLIAGGVVLRVDGELVGAVGVSGGSAAQDAELAAVGRARFEAGTTAATEH